MESSHLCGFIKNWRTLGRVLAFSPRVLWYEVPNHQFKCCEVGLDEFHVGFDEFFCKKENVGFLKEILSKFGKTPVFVLVID